MTEIRVVLAIAEAFLPEQSDRAIRLLSDYIDKTEPPSYAAIVKLLGVLRAARSPKQAFAIIERFKLNAEARGFHAVWARLVVDQSSITLAQQTLNDPSFRLDAVRAEDPATAYRMLKLARNATALTVLVEALESALSSGSMAGLLEVAELFQEEGRLDEFKARARGNMPSRMLEDIVERVQAHERRYRLFR